MPDADLCPTEGTMVQPRRVPGCRTHRSGRSRHQCSGYACRQVQRHEVLRGVEIVLHLTRRSRECALLVPQYGRVGLGRPCGVPRSSAPWFRMDKTNLDPGFSAAMLSSDDLYSGDLANDFQNALLNYRTGISLAARRATPCPVRWVQATKFRTNPPSV